tara:strand:+ start:742 stop:876 length:135 start_codon:yes stop_codon:yes gene_type:complete
MVVEVRNLILVADVINITILYFVSLSITLMMFSILVLVEGGGSN